MFMLLADACHCTGDHSPAQRSCCKLSLTRSLPAARVRAAVNGKPCPRAEAVLPMRELSYSWLNSATEVVQSGQPVRVVVLFQQPAPDAKVVVSLKRLEEDPLKETLDNVLPLNNQVRGSLTITEMQPTAAAAPPAAPAAAAAKQ